ncbi:hypothetical protein SORBI_3001G292500 [Sorghum bicolor]|uniref:Uncharacterized protein n=1 Tax=Sorghum bicolor TaxID=4558 RepID=A0A1B6QLT6_SORBI|nr:hypothetical protein SORBI_3001G292500 [Sorghum bicolor]
MAHYKSDNRMRGNRYDGKYVKGPHTIMMPGLHAANNTRRQCRAPARDARHQGCWPDLHRHRPSGHGCNGVGLKGSHRRA